MLTPQPATLIGNGATDRRASYTASPDDLLLFIGPVPLHAQNLHGILAFIDEAWPALRAEVSGIAPAHILGGVESAAIAERDARLRQPGIELVSAFVDPTPHSGRMQSQHQSASSTAHN